MGDWWPDLSETDKPRYLAIADAIAEDIRNGRLAPADRLPPQRKLARLLKIDFTTAWGKAPSCVPAPGAAMARSRAIRKSSTCR